MPPEPLGELLFAFDFAAWFPPPRWHVPSPATMHLFARVITERDVEAARQGQARVLVLDGEPMRPVWIDGSGGWPDLSLAIYVCWRCGEPWVFAAWVEVDGVVVAGGLCLECAADELCEPVEALYPDGWLVAPEVRPQWTPAPGA